MSLNYLLATSSIVLLLMLVILPSFQSEHPSHSAYATVGSFVDSKVVGGISGPTAMEFAPDGRLFVTEKGGAVKVIQNGVLLPTPFLSVSVDTSGERGLESLTFDPNFTKNGYVYVYYTTSDSPPHNRVSRFSADPVNPNISLVGSEVQILNLENLTALWHNGGGLHFGKDGKLYVSVGENGNSANAQTLANRLGKILRINSNGSIPSDNPFFNIPSAKKEIWALGLRNPFTFAFSPAAGNTMYINDVGQSTWEEVDPGIRGANYGWPTCEGFCVPHNPNFVDPIITYNHDSSSAAITGGVFYNSNQFPPEYNGSYFFGDYALNFIKRLTPANQVVNFLPTINSPVDLDVGTDGSLYYLSHGKGEVHKVQFVPGINHFPHANATATPTSGLPPLNVTFDGSLSTDPDPGTVLNYSWDFGDGFTGSGVLVNHTYNVAGPKVATLTVTDGSGGIDSTSINISVGIPPIGTIITPVVGTKYNAGDTISFSGNGTDTKDGSLPASAFKWVILFHHQTHTHPFLEFDGVKKGTFTIPTLGETSPVVWYRLYLTVTDSLGLTQTFTRDVIPNESTITLASNVPGLFVNLDGQPQTTPTSFVGVVGINRTLGVPGPQILGGITYKFQSWSDGGAQNHTISTPASNTTYAATSVVIVPFKPVVYMNDTVASGGQPLSSGTPIRAEYASATSVLVGKNIDTIQIKLKKNAAPNGTAIIGVFNADASVKKVFGTKDVSSLTTSSVDYSFPLPVGQTYQIASGDRIGIKFTGGDSKNSISIMTDKTNAFDGTNSYRTTYTTSWGNTLTEDLYMILKLSTTSVSADTTPPTLSILSPSNNTSTTTTTVPVSGIATDDSLVVQSVKWKVDSGPVSTASGTANWSFTTASLSVGGHTIWVNATDPSGNVATRHLGITITASTTGSIMNDTVASGGQPIYSGKPIQAEYASATSALVGKNMNSILVNLKKVGTLSGTAQIGVFNTDLSVKQLFGTIDVSTISTSSTQYTFALSSSQTYLIQSGDRIGIQFTGGDSLNRVSVMTDKTNAFDGTNSYRTTYTTSWGNTLTEDIYMILK